jgi:cysteine-rich repeat protein
MTSRRLVLSLLALFAVSCSNEVTRTQLTFRIDAAAGLRNSIQVLHVEVTSKGVTQKEDFTGKLNWPVEIVVLPEGGQASTYEVELYVQARGAGGQPLAEDRKRGSFAPERVSVVALQLGPVDPPDQDAGSEEEERDANVEPVRDAGGEVDSNTPDNCETNSKIKCDDDNPCNGDESCNPESSNADAKGCVPSDSPVMCSQDMTCDSKTGECSTCLAKPDGDGDGAESIACGGLDCDDNNKDVAPGKAEKCNNRDDDCDGVRDGTKADADCTASAPTGGTASCVSGICTGACTNPTYQIVNGACVPPPVECPGNPCAPGSCVAGSPTYVCICQDGYRAGVGNTRCAPVGVPTRTLGFETSCGNASIPSPTPPEEKIAIAPTQFAACGVTSVTGTPLTTVVHLVRPTVGSATMIDGITDATALEVPMGTGGTPQLSINFAPMVTALSFDLLDIDDASGLSITLRSGEMPAFAGGELTPLVGKRMSFKYLDPARPVDLVVITYAPLSTVPPAPADRLFIDQLSYRVGGCGDGEVEGVETCDDGNLMQCDGCDNACAINSASSLGCGP